MLMLHNLIVQDESGKGGVDAWANTAAFPVSAALTISDRKTAQTGECMWITRR